MELANLYEKLFEKFDKNRYSLIEDDSNQYFLDHLGTLQRELNFTFPESFIVFVKTIGLGYFRNNHSDEIVTYSYKDLILFNIGEDRFPELEDYIVFGQDEGSYLYLFDPRNKLQKGKNAIFRNTMDGLTDEDMEFLAKDMSEFFALLANDKKLNRKRLKDEEGFDNSLKYDGSSAEIEMTPHLADQMEQIQKYIDSMDKKKYRISEKKQALDYIQTLEEQHEIKYPASYLAVLKNYQAGSFGNDHLRIIFLDRDSLFEYNVKKRKPLFKKFIVIAMTTKSEHIFLDPQDKLGKGENAIFRIKVNAKKIDQAFYLAKDFAALFEMLANNVKPNDIPL
ncbi:MAG: SMI1/KNR4 family protein [Spirochaetes bacterium]|nr:SMI1/KNR4 family protein [Spirochaetota bacterium]